MLLPTFYGRSALSETQLLLRSNQNSFRTPTFRQGLYVERFGTRITVDRDRWCNLEEEKLVLLRLA